MVQTTINEHVFIGFILLGKSRGFQKRPFTSSKKKSLASIFADSRTRTRSAMENFARVAREKRFQRGLDTENDSLVCEYKMKPHTKTNNKSMLAAANWETNPAR